MEYFEIILVLLYAALFSFLILRLKFFQHFHLPVKLIAVIFLIKVAAGIVYGYLHLTLYSGGDTYSYFNDSIIVFSTLKPDPWLYLRLVFGISYGDPAADIVPFKDAMMYYTTSGSYFLVRFHSIMRLISFSYYNVHVVFYNFFTLTGLLYLFLFLEGIIPKKRMLLLIAVFLFPSILFWSSGMHKDGISLAALGLLLYSSKQIISEKKINSRPNFRNFITLLIGVWLLLIVRNFWLLLLFPALTAFVWTIRAPKYKLIKFILVYVIYFGVATNLNVFGADWNFLNMLVQKQAEFISLNPGQYPLPVYTFDSAFWHIVRRIPNALSNCLFQPLVTNVTSPLLLFAAIENILILLSFLPAIILRKKKLHHSEGSLLLLCLFFTFTLFSVLGMTVPILGALLRYKMVGVMSLLITVIVFLKDNVGEVRFMRRDFTPDS